MHDVINKKSPGNVVALLMRGTAKGGEVLDAEHDGYDGVATG